MTSIDIFYIIDNKFSCFLVNLTLKAYRITKHNTAKAQTVNEELKTHLEANDQTVTVCFHPIMVQH